MLDRTRSLVALRLVAGAAVVALTVAACGGSSATPSPTASAAAPTPAAPVATPAPTAPPQEQPSASAAAGGGTTTGACADVATVAAALKNVDHYVANAKIGVQLPGDSASGLAMDMVMKFQKPDRFEISSGIGGGVLFAMKKVGEDSWLQMFGADTWTKADASTASDQSASDLLSGISGQSVEPLATIPANLDLPGSSSCVVGYTIKVPDIAAGDMSNPLSSLSGATAIALRVDTSTNLPESMGFVIDTSKAGVGAPTSMVFTFDYQTPVDIQAPDPSKVTEGGLGGFPLPSGMVLPSGLQLP